MNAPKEQNPKGYRLSFIINTAVGGLMLALSAVGKIMETAHPSLGSALSGDFLWPAMICFFIASLHYSKYLSVSR